MIDVWSQYQSKDSGFKVREEPIKDFPTLTICTGPFSNYRYEYEVLLLHTIPSLTEYFIQKKIPRITSYKIFR